MKPLPGKEPAGGWAWICPVCGNALGAGNNTMNCEPCGVSYPCKDGIWRFLPPLRAQALSRFLEEYRTVRKHEGWGSQDSTYYRDLPGVAADDPNQAVWRLRERSYRAFTKHVLAVAERSAAAPLRILDLGAGNGWLANRLARRGHAVAAVDLKTDGFDGLGAHVHFKTVFTRVQAEFEHLPFAGGQFDLAIFNGSLHYATDYRIALTEALRALKSSGRIVIVDSPVYRDAQSGAAMVAEREQRFCEAFGFSGASLEAENFLTPRRLDGLSAELAIDWQIIRPGFGMGWALRSWRARLFGPRPPASLPVIAGVRATKQPIGVSL